MDQWRLLGEQLSEESAKRKVIAGIVLTKDAPANAPNGNEEDGNEANAGPLFEKEELLCVTTGERRERRRRRWFMANIFSVIIFADRLSLVYFRRSLFDEGERLLLPTSNCRQSEICICNLFIFVCVGGLAFAPETFARY